MEHAGATFLREDSVLFPFSRRPPTCSGARSCLPNSASVVRGPGHDALVRRSVAQGIANFMAAKATEALLPELDAECVSSLKIAAYRTDATRDDADLAVAAQPRERGVRLRQHRLQQGPSRATSGRILPGENEFRSAVREFTAPPFVPRTGVTVEAFEHASAESGPWAVPG
jgi:hypothetical protein